MGWRKETRKSENNVRNSGRKTKKVELNFTDDGLEDAKNEILNICSNDETKENDIQLIEDLKKELINVDSVETQTSNLKPTVKNQATQVNDADEEDSLDSILNVMKKLDNDDLTILFQNTFHFLNEESKSVNIRPRCFQPEHLCINLYIGLKRKLVLTITIIGAT